MRLPAISISLFILFFAAYGEEDGVKKYRNYTPKEILALPDKTINSEVPMMYSIAARSGLSEGADLLFGMQLNHLMYSGIPDYRGAIKEFQKDLGDESTGTLTVSQIHTLETRSEMQKLGRVGFPNQYSSFNLETVASVQGTMIILDDKISSPINHVEVRCFKEEEYCQLNQMDLVTPKEDSWSQTYQVINFSPVYYRITRWTKDLIDAEPDDDKNACRTTSMNFNFKTDEYFFITRNTGKKCVVLGTEIEQLPKPRISQIVDGSQIFSAEFNKIKATAFDALSSEFKQKVDSLQKQQ